MQRFTVEIATTTAFGADCAVESDAVSDEALKSRS
jgi:hypothetical protein